MSFLSLEKECYGYGKYSNFRKGSIFYHYKNLNPYEYIGPCRIQENDMWVEAVIYKEYKSLVDSGMFVRTKKEFLENFKRKEE